MTKIWGHFGNQIWSPKPYLARWKNTCNDFQQDRSRDWQCPNNNCTLPQLGADMTHPAGFFCLAILQDPKVEKETLSSDQSASSVVRLGHSMVLNFLARSFCLAWHTLHSSRFDSQSLSNFFWCCFLVLCPSSVCNGTMVMMCMSNSFKFQASRRSAKSYSATAIIWHYTAWDGHWAENACWSGGVFVM